MLAVVGSGVGVATAYMLGAAWHEISIGLWGYNSVLGTGMISAQHHSHDNQIRMIVVVLVLIL